jgi:c-di-AMP phosphodiesterase-like protein
MNSKLTDIATLKRILPLVVAAYCDYQHYLCSLDSLAENFDESLETFDRTTWYNMILGKAGNSNTDDYAIDCVESLGDAVMCFERIKEQAEDGLTLLLKTILSLPPEKQMQIFDRAFKVEPQQLDKAIEKMFDEFAEVDYQYNVEANYENFFKLIDSGWADYQVSV